MTAVTGIDLSLTSTGICRLDGINLEGLATVHRIQSKGAKGASVHDRATRVVDVADRILQCVNAGDLIVIEGPSFGQMRQSGEHLRAGLWWYLVTLLDMNGHEVIEVPPATLKKYATGSGASGKDQVLAAAVRRYPTIDITGNDIADATILAAIGARLQGNPIEDSLPQTHLAALGKLEGIAA